VVLVRGDGSAPTALRVGDSTELGRATVTLVGLLPLLEGEEGRAAAAAATAATATTGRPSPRRAKARRRRGLAGRSFEEELVAGLRRTPWFALSAGVHAVVVFLLLILLPGMPDDDPPERRLALLETTTGFELDDRPSPVEDEAAPPEPPAAPEEEPVPVIDPADLPPPLPPAPSEELEPEERYEPPPTVLGAARALAARGASAPPPPPPVAGADAVNYDPDKAGDFNRRAAAAVLDAARRGGGRLARVLEGLRPSDILVVKGSFDEMERTLDALALPYTLRSPQDLGPDYDYLRHRLVFWNCGEFPTKHTRERVAADVRAFVKAGGYLFTTDWMISNLLVDAFPEMLATTGRERPLAEAVVDVRPAAGMESHPLLEGVFLPDAAAKWWIEGASHDILVLRRSRVETLIESPSLALASMGGRSPAVAVTFPHGRGRVLHVLGHYFQKQGSVAGTIAAQRLALNFVRLRVGREGHDVPDR
jgi:hypothetical protein